jgi:WD40 repeat protein
LTFSPEGKSIAIGTEFNRSAPLIVLTTSNNYDKYFGYVPTPKHNGQLLHFVRIGGVAFRPDGRAFVTAYDSPEADNPGGESLMGSGVALWHIPDIRPPDFESKIALNKSLVVSAGPVRGVAFNPDGTTVVIAYGNRSVVSWKIGDKSYKLISKIGSEFEQIGDIAFSPGAQVLAATFFYNGRDTVTLWDVAANQRLADFALNGGRIKSVDIRADGRSLAAAYYLDGNAGVAIWDIKYSPTSVLP